MTPEQKALKACADYARLSAEIRTLGSALGRHLGGCRGSEPRPVPDHEYFAVSDTHLKQAYAGKVVSTDWGPHHRYYSETEIREILAVCPHCLAAHEAIQARKAARRSLGAAKRQIGLMGRKAIAQA